MRLLRHYQEIPDDCRGAVITIGNFDGVHRGHQAVLERTRAIAAECSAPAAVMAFEPHPRRYFQPDAAPFRLTSLREKTRLLEAAGVDILMAYPFDRDMAGMAAEVFVHEILVGALSARHIVVGYDFQFGKNRSGDIGLLREMGRKEGFGVTVIEPVATQDGAYSSSRVRQCLRDGDPRAAADLLGHYWVVEGRVREGDRRGRQLGFPTANLSLHEYVLPRFGGYVVRADILTSGEDAEGPYPAHKGVANIGRRPTFDKEETLLEVHLFDFDGDLYGAHLRVHFFEFLRPEQKFDGIEALKAQLHEDSGRARDLLGVLESDGVLWQQPFVELATAQNSGGRNSPEKPE